MKDCDFDIAIIGGGPAGMTAALYAARDGSKTVVLEKGMKGGPYSITDEIENFPGFPDGVKTEELMDRFRNQAERFGCEVRAFTTVASIRDNGHTKTVVLDDETEISARVIIIATGASPARIGVPGEVEYTGRGVSYCATCDGPLFKGKDILVIGGGNAAVEEALFLTRFVDSVTIVHRRDKLRADDVLVKRAEAEPKISFRWNSVLTEVRGDMLVHEAVLTDVISGETEAVPIGGVFIFVGAIPVTDFLPAGIEREKRGFILTNEDLLTAIPGIYAAGDCRNGSLKQIVGAAAEGALAAIMAEKYIETLGKECTNG
jgi:thioredoxin reductase (NADPH)